MIQLSRNQREGRYAGRFRGRDKRTHWVPRSIGLSKAQWKLHLSTTQKIKILVEKNEH